jgi:murein tripeptide amidase MpaA
VAFSIEADFSSGSIEVLRARGQGPVELALRDDSAADIRQWFHFAVRSDSEKRRRLVIANASEATFANGWEGYRAMVQRAGRGWARAETSYDGTALTIIHEPRSAVTRYAYFAPYPVTRLDRLLGQLNEQPWVDVSQIGESVEGRPLHAVSFGDEDARRTVWIIARQHPGETPASWAMEGLLDRLANGADEAVGALLSEARVVVVPLVNPDGAELGNHRTSASGVNLNRVWDDPSADDAPEVVAIRAAIEATGVDLFFDVHADESHVFAFAACTEGNPSYTDEIAEAEAAIRDDLAEVTPEFLDEPGYDLDEPGEADLSCAANFIGESFGCPAVTLELPIRDSQGERVKAGWSPGRAVRFGRNMVDVLRRSARR